MHPINAESRQKRRLLTVAARREGELRARLQLEQAEVPVALGQRRRVKHSTRQHGSSTVGGVGVQTAADQSGSDNLRRRCGRHVWPSPVGANEEEIVKRSDLPVARPWYLTSSGGQVMVAPNMGVWRMLAASGRSAYFCCTPAIDSS